MAGKIIVIEGTECSGKETQSKLLEQNLQKMGKECIRFEFPMYDTPTGKIVGRDYLGKKEMGESLFTEGSMNVDPHVVCLYYAADRKYNLSKIEEYIKKDYYVILDRYTTSNLAHQGSKIQDKDNRFDMYQWIDKLEYWLLQLPKPDKTIFLHVPFETALTIRTNKEGKETSEESLKRAEEAYLELTELYNWDKIECVQNGTLKSIDDIQQEILNKIEELS